MSGADFDKRPGFLEATREPCPARAPIVVVGRRSPDGWRVALLQGATVVAELAPGEAMALSIEIAHAAGLVTRADLCDFGGGGGDD